ncbi:MAG: hypothetical protein M1823_005780 [Watsoniomyces obsoletus]|nr:MAG: hypothetical protein M1823_005780 [Watsoniomyces obsoletus]
MKANRKDRSLGTITESLRRIEAKLEDLPRQVAEVIPTRQRSSPAAAAAETSQPGISRRPLSWQVIQDVLEKDLNDRAHHLRAFREGGLVLVAEIERFHSLPAASRLEAQTISVPQHPGSPDLGRRVVFPCVTLEMMQGLSTCYFESFNSTYPLLDSQWYYANILPKIVRVGIGDHDTESIIALLVMALGRHAVDGITTEPLDPESGRFSGLRGGVDHIPPGITLFDEARARMGFEMTLYRLEHVQIFILAALFYGQSCRHSDYWRMCSHACTSCKALISCGVLLDLEFPTVDLSALEDIVPLPTFMGSDDNGEAQRMVTKPNFPYHFLAQVSLRHVVARVYANLYETAPRSLYGVSHYEPSRYMVAEMARQLDGWRSLLPNGLSWHDDQNEEMPHPMGEPSPSEPLFVGHRPPKSPPQPFEISDILTAALRSRYQYVRVLIYLPYVYKALTAPQFVSDDDVQFCIMCLRACLRWPITMSSPKEHKRLLPHLYGWTISLLNVLIILYMTTKSPLLRGVRENNFAAGEMEESVALMLDWIRDMAKIDAVAERAWSILEQLFPM